MAALHLLLFFLLLAPLSLSIPHREPLLEFKASLSKTTRLVSWHRNTSPCRNHSARWTGIVCSQGVVIGINLNNMGLSGTINIDALEELPGLRNIALANNSFSGPIPEFKRITSLKGLFLSNNNFSGKIPSDFFSTMESLKKLWLNGNKFSGEIPHSLEQVPNLVEVHLECNEFSGPIPSLNGGKSLVSLNMSHNHFEGEIPEDMLNFTAASFEGNSELCGKAMAIECKKVSSRWHGLAPAPSKALENGVPEQKPETTKVKSKIGLVVVGLMGSFLLLTLLLYYRKPKNVNDFHVLGKENHSHKVVEVFQLPRNSSKASLGSSRKRNGSTKVGSHRKSISDVVMVNLEKGVFGLQDLLKASAEMLGNGSLGSAYKAVMGNGMAVVVKRMKELDNLSSEVFDNEMLKLGKLKHPNILTPLGYYYRGVEKLLVSEYVPKGSLAYVLHGDRGTAHTELNWASRLRIIQGVVRGMGYLHTEFSQSELPHGNLKSTNVLLDSNHEPLLCDYGFHSLINDTESVHSLLAYKSPEAILYHQVSPKSDVYCLGIIILEIITGKFPSQYCNNQKGGTDIVQWFRTVVSEGKEKELIDPEIANYTSGLGQMEMLLHIGASCIADDPKERLDIWEAIKKIEGLKL